ncbi:MAG: PQQ-binding-like beta-propeller repeat protein [Lentisphaeria bacterium]|nr:PQQ-binding-like beta-propeller repeat protein [Lentisphaeria bacterium]
MKYVLMIVFFSLGNLLSAQDEEEKEVKSPEDIKKAILKDINQELSALNIKANEEEIIKFLKSIVPTDANKKRISALVKQLGADEFKLRKAADKELASLLILASEAVTAGVSSSDPEISDRCRRLLERYSSVNKEAVFQNILEFYNLEKLQKELPLLVQNLSYFYSDYLRRELTKTFVLISKAEDIEMIKPLLKSENENERLVSLEILATGLKEGELKLLEPFLNSKHDKEKLVLAKIFLQRDKRSSLKTLIGLLKSPVLDSRYEALNILSSLAGKSFGYDSELKGKELTQAIERWEKWLGDEGATVKLDYKFSSKVNLHGNLLYSNGHKGMLIEIDKKGKQVFSYNSGVRQQMNGFAKSSAGNYYICLQNTNKVIEVNPKGKIIWEVVVQMPTSVQILPSGNLLVCSGKGNEIIEITRAKKVIWRQKAIRPWWAERLANGNTLFLESNNRVVEKTKKGKDVWQYAVRTCLGAQRLKNGNTIIADFQGNRVIEVDKKGKIHWTHNVQRPYSVTETNGEVVVGTSSNILVIDKKKNTVIKTIGGVSYGRGRK